MSEKSPRTLADGAPNEVFRADRPRLVAQRLPIQLSVAAKKGTKMAAKWSPAKGAVRSEPFPLLRSVVRNGPEPSRARRCWARRTLDGEDRSEMIAEEGKAGRKIGERWSAILVPSPAASNTPRRITLISQPTLPSGLPARPGRRFCSRSCSCGVGIVAVGSLKLQQESSASC